MISFYKKINIFLILLLLCLNSSTLQARDLAYGVITSHFKNTIYNASYTQWNEEYAITANHVKNVSGSVYSCSSGCDLQFFKKKNENFDISWRDPVKGEKLYFLGQDKYKNDKIKLGVNVDKNVIDSDTNRIIGKLALVSVEEGMSGGPVYAEDGKLVGMSFAVVNKSLDKNGPYYYSVFIPYAMIKQQWEEYITKNK